MTGHLWERARGLVLVAAATAAMGCGPGEVKAPNPMRALDERRAVEVIARAVRKAGAEPAAGRDIKLAVNGKTLHIDVGVQGRLYGVAYITDEDAKALGDAVGPPNKKDEKLHLRTSDDGETKVVILYQSNYVYDDLAGEEHEQTAITCESSLMRDVEDFVTHAKAKGYK